MKQKLIKIDGDNEDHGRNCRNCRNCIHTYVIQYQLLRMYVNNVLMCLNIVLKYISCFVKTLCVSEGCTDAAK